MTPFELPASDGLILRGRKWEVESPRGIVCLVHGLGEHSGRYEHVAHALNQADFSVAAIDLRGHGLSDGRRGHADYKALMSDLALLTAAAQQPHPNRPLFLYGHSLGGNLVLNFALEQKHRLAGIVASAPLFRLAFEPPKWKSAAMKLLKNLPISLPSGLDDTALSRDPDVARRYREDPLVHRRISPRLATDMLQHGVSLLHHADTFHLPILLIQGEDDRITSIAATRQFSRTTSADCTLKTWPGMRHEPHEEPEQHEAFEVVTEWMKRYS